MPLHLTYRPQTLKEIVGNRETVAAIDALLARKKDVPRAWLFHGPSGCGKTTLARIVADKLGVKGMDLNEMNIADTRGIDDARAIIERMRMKPMAGERRAFLLDEVHMATKEFQNTMLKALEDTPEHVVFLLCTTDPTKLLKTIRNRCHEFKVEPLGSKAIVSMLADVSRREKITIPEEVLAQIAEDSGGSPRQALVVLDKIIDMAPADMKAAAKQYAEETAEAIELCRALIDGKGWTTIMPILSRLGEADVEKVRLAVVGYCNAILLKKDSPRAWVVMDAFREPFDRIGKPGLTWAAYMATTSK